MKKTELVIFRPRKQKKFKLFQIKIRLDRSIGMRSKLRINTNFNILKTVYHSLFQSQLHYGTQLWGQKNNETITTFRKPQNRALRKVTFKKRHDRISCV